MKSIYFLCMIFLIATASAFTITTDEITQTSIVWNLSQKPAEVNITTIAFDGIEQADFILNPDVIVQTDLNPGESHYIDVIDSSEFISHARAKTLSPPSDQWWEFATGYFLFIIALVCIFIGLYVPFVAFAGVGFAIFGIVEMQGVSFWGGFIFMVIFCAGVFVGFAKLKE